VQVERDGEPSRDRRGKQSGKGQAKDAADVLTAIVEADDGSPMPPKGTVMVVLELRGGRSVAKLVDKLSEIDGVSAVKASDVGLISD
jgi:hypothetical protein